MPRILLRVPPYLALAAIVAAALLGQPVKAHADGAHHRHVHRAAAADRYRSVEAIIAEAQTSPFYRQFGGYYEAAAASQYDGPYARHYFGFGPGWQ